jgi:hypothetical protein
VSSTEPYQLPTAHPGIEPVDPQLRKLLLLYWFIPVFRSLGRSSAVPLLDNSFLLNLDSSVSVPVVLKDVNAASSLDLPPLGTIITQTPRSPPGKFYRPESSVILDTLKTGGPSARLSPKEGATDVETQHFERFRQRLQSGDIVSTIHAFLLLQHFC